MDVLEWIFRGGRRLWNDALYFVTGDHIWDNEEKPVLTPIPPVHSETDIAEEINFKKCGDKKCLEYKLQKHLGVF